MTPAGLPHSDTPGSSLACSSPRLFAACHVLLRRLVPRHPPCALSRLTHKVPSMRPPTRRPTSTYTSSVVSNSVVYNAITKSTNSVSLAFLADETPSSHTHFSTT